MNKINNTLIKDLEKATLKNIRDGFGEGLVLAGEKNKKVVALCADLTDSTRMSFFRDEFKERFVEIGVAEQNLASVASGLAAVGKIPFIASYAMFSPGRNWEQIRTTIAYNNQNVKIAGAHAGISVGPDGATHQALEDIAIMRAIPNMVVLSPCDYNEAKKMTLAVARHKGPVYFRFPREATPVFTTVRTPFKIGRAEVFREGSGVTIVASGSLVYEALLAAEVTDAEVINCHTIKPLDKETILKSVKKTGRVVTVEEHQVNGGLGSAVAELLVENNPVPMRRVGVRDSFGETGEPEELLEKFGLKAKNIIEAIEELNIN
ncbi:MAG: transketolase [Parcubacteria group bacterium]|nr:transketolase [Parcubacteria group bacterium]